jgi:hypothetical protein
MKPLSMTGAIGILPARCSTAGTFACAYGTARQGRGLRELRRDVTVHQVVSIGGENNAGLPTDAYSKMRDVPTP